LADITFTLTPKHEWDVAAGAALVVSAGGYVGTLDNSPLICNNRKPWLPGLIACGPHLRTPLLALLEDHLQAAGEKKTLS
jgi:myo-inositol-1(or 4)-monophosphatase